LPAILLPPSGVVFLGKRAGCPGKVLHLSPAAGRASPIWYTWRGRRPGMPQINACFVPMQDDGARLQFLGANRQVTGSRHYLDTGRCRVLVDCGQFQERPYLDRNWEPSPVPLESLDAVVLTHAHIDHCGLLPRLVRQGLRAPIYATEASAELVEIVLRDSAHIHEEDAAFKQKRHRKEGRTGPHPVVPLFTNDDVDRLMPLVRGVPYGRRFRLGQDLEAVFHDAGHILGSAIVEFSVRRPAGTDHVVFSGDLGQWDRPILRDPTLLEEADYVIMESTYGDREHTSREDVESQLAAAIVRTVGRGGNVVIPTFAIERAQELMYHLSRLFEQHRIPRVPVYLDSPMAIAVTRLFDRHRECYDEITQEIVNRGRQPLGFPSLRLVRTPEESKAINDSKMPAVIMATSGMCTAGRIKHHLVHNVGRPECMVLFTGFQVRGTLGRQILDGNPEVRIHGRMHRVRAEVAEIQGLSGHADRPALLRWLSALRRPPRGLFLVHGEESSSLALADQVRRQWNWNVLVPHYQQVVALNGT